MLQLVNPNKGNKMERKIELKSGNIMNIFHDDNPQDPREDDNICKMYCFHDSYILGDKHDIRTNEYDNMNDLIEHNTLPKSDIVLNLYLLDHGGISISYNDFSEKWDSGRVGFAVVPVSKIVSEYGDDSPKSRELALKCMKAEIDLYNQYITGDVYGYEVVREEKCSLGHVHPTEVDSCWGFYGDCIEDMLEHAGEKRK